MKNNTGTGVIIGVIIVIGVIAGFLQYQRSQKPDNAGSLYIGITDATADISDVNEVNMSVNKVELYSATKGWVNVASNSKSYKLLSLNESGKTELYAKADVSAGTYDKVRVTLGDVVVNTKSKGDVKAVLPSSKVVVGGKVVVKKGANTNVKLDVLADQSLHTTLAGEYVFASVIKAESRSNADVALDKDNSVKATGGEIDSSVSVGVDLSGNSREDFKLKTGSSLKIESSDEGKPRFYLGGEMYEEKDTDIDDKSQRDDSSIKTDIKLQSDDSMEKDDDGDIENENEKENEDNNKAINIDLKGGIQVGQ